LRRDEAAEYLVLFSGLGWEESVPRAFDFAGASVVAVPKRRTSPSKQGKRRSHDALVAPALNICPQCKHAIPPHKVCDLVAECGNVQRSKPHNPAAEKKS
jgi:large subunit ribosomal protein L32